MFKKAFTIKSNTTVRNSDRRKLVSKFGDSAAEVFGKSAFSLAVISTFNNVNGKLYISEKEPIFFEISGIPGVYPTLSLTWKSHVVYPTILVLENVLPFLQNGADLMLPGVTFHPGTPLPTFPAGEIVCLASYSAARASVMGPIAVGRALMSSDEMIACGMRGKGVQVLHFYQDELWSFGDRAAPPVVPAQVYFDSTPVSESPVPASDEPQVDAPEGEIDPENEIKSLEDETEELQIDDNFEVVELPSEEPADDKPEVNLEDLLRSAFLAAVKFHLSADQRYPLDVGQFYASHVLKALPEGVKIDIKKTQFKKFVNFLTELNKSAAKDGKWFVKMAAKKGVDSITAVNTEHPDVVAAVPLANCTLSDASGKRKQAGTGKVKVADCFSATVSGLKLLKQLNPSLGFRQGDVIFGNDLSDVVKRYIAEKNLVRDSGKTVLDDTLQSIMKSFLPSETVPINNVVQAIQSKMTKAYLLTGPDGRRTLHRARLPLVAFAVERRAGNKHVTLVNNITVYGIDAKEFSSMVQTKVATGATINAQGINCIGPQVLVNGNQVTAICKILVDTYGLQKTYIHGAELGVASKKPGKK